MYDVHDTFAVSYGTNVQNTNIIFADNAAQCAGACVLFGIRRVIIGENRTFLGAESFLKERGVEVINLGMFFQFPFIESLPNVSQTLTSLAR